MNKVHIFEINTLIRIDSKIWICSLSSPNKPLLRIEKSEYNLIVSGLFLHTGKPLFINGKNYHLSENLYDRIKEKCDETDTDITKLCFIKREFYDDNIDRRYEILTDHFSHLKNKEEDVYIICSQSNKENYRKIIEKLEEEMSKMGIAIKDYYYFTDTFNNRDTDEIRFKKLRLLIQLLTGKKTNGTSFTNTDITRYDSVYYYDDSFNTVEYIKNINSVLYDICSNSDEQSRLNVRDVIRKFAPILYLNFITFNKVNRFDLTEIPIKFTNYIKTFESFKSLQK